MARLFGVRRRAARRSGTTSGKDEERVSMQRPRGEDACVSECVCMQLSRTSQSNQRGTRGSLTDTRPLVTHARHAPKCGEGWSASANLRYVCRCVQGMCVDE